MVFRTESLGQNDEAIPSLYLYHRDKRYNISYYNLNPYNLHYYDWNYYNWNYVVQKNDVNHQVLDFQYPWNPVEAQFPSTVTVLVTVTTGVLHVSEVGPEEDAATGAFDTVCERICVDIMEDGMAVDAVDCAAAGELGELRAAAAVDTTPDELEPALCTLLPAATVDATLTVEEPMTVGPSGAGGEMVDVVCGVNVLPAFGGPL